MSDDGKHSGEHADPWRVHAMDRLNEIAKDMRELAAFVRDQLTAGASEAATLRQEIALLKAANAVRDRADAEARSARESSRAWNLGVMSIISILAVGAGEVIRFLAALGHAATAAGGHP